MTTALHALLLLLLGTDGFYSPTLDICSSQLHGTIQPRKASQGSEIEDTETDAAFRSFSRSQFPFYAAQRAPKEYGGEQWVFLENAGGSQVPQAVVDACSEALAVRWRSELGPKHVAAARNVAEAMLNAEDSSNIVLGSSASELFRSIAGAYAHTLQPGDEIIVCEWSHEAHIAPWLWAAEASGATVKWWRFDSSVSSSQSSGGDPPSLDTLKALVGPKTRLAALTHVSNILGSVFDVTAATTIVREASGGAAHVAVDGVAYVPHKAPNVQAIGCDWYAFSCYKAFGPHCAVLYGTRRAFESMQDYAPNHPFVDSENKGNVRWELGTMNQEAAAGLAGLGNYFIELANWRPPSAITLPLPSESRGYSSALCARSEARLSGNGGLCTATKEAVSTKMAVAAVKASHVADCATLQPSSQPPLTRATVEAAYKRISACEGAPASLLLQFLASRPHVRILGRPDMQGRVPTVSLIHSKLKASDLCDFARESKIVCRHGSFLAPRLLEALGVSDPLGDGVLRFSLAHYNTIEDVERTMSMLVDAGF